MLVAGFSLGVLLTIDACRTSYSGSLWLSRKGASAAVAPGLDENARPPDAQRVVAVVSEIAKQFGLEPVSTHGHFAQFESPPYPREGWSPHLIVTVTSSVEPRGFRVTVLDLTSSRDEGKGKSIRDALQSRLASALPDYVLELTGGTVDTSFSP